MTGPLLSNRNNLLDHAAITIVDFMKKLLLPLWVFASALGLAAADQPAFSLKDNDTWVMAGDSITAQRLHTNFIEAFFRARYPQLHLHFRNAGVGSSTVTTVLGRFDCDVAAWKPTIVSIELGMNDSNAPVPNREDCYIAGMKKLADQTRVLNAQPLFISSTPVNDGSMMGTWVPGRCQSIHLITEALNALGQKENIRVVDQYHPLIAVWGPNKTRDDANAIAGRINKTIDDVNSLAERMRTLKPEGNIPDLAPLQALAKSWESKTDAVKLGGDAIHTGPVGQYMMAATILAALNVDRDVSSATINPDGTVVEAKNCNITGATSKEGRLTFTRLDERSPWPLLPEAITANSLLPEIAGLSRYILTVPGLPDGQFDVKMDGKPVATVSSKALAQGWNMSLLREGPLGERADKIMTLIGELQGPLNIAWRTASKENNQEKLQAAQKAIDENEAKLQAAIQPVPIQFEIAPAK